MTGVTVTSTMSHVIARLFPQVYPCRADKSVVLAIRKGYATVGRPTLAMRVLSRLMEYLGKTGPGQVALFSSSGGLPAWGVSKRIF